MTGEENLTVMGVITGAHGIKGDVKITSFTDDPASLKDFAPLTDKGGGQNFKITSARVHKANVLIARIDGVDDRNGAEALRGTKLYFDRSLLPEPDEGEFYHADLVGLSAFDTSGTLFGAVTSVQNFGAGDLLEIILDGQKKTILIPFTIEAVPAVDIAAGRLTVLPPEGLLEPAKQDDGRDDPKDG